MKSTKNINNYSKKILILSMITSFASVYAGAVSRPEAGGRESYYHYMRGLAYERSGETKKARKEFETTLKDDPEAVSAYRELILIHMADNDIERVIPLVNRLSKMQIDDAETNNFIGGIYILLKDTASAIVFYSKALEEDPKNVNAVIALGEIYTDADPDTAIKYWQKYLEFDPDSGTAEYQTGLAYIRMGKIGEAKNKINEALKKDPGNITPKIALAQIYESEKKYAEAAEEYMKILDTDRSDPLFFIKAGTLYYMAGKQAEAQDMFNKTLQFFPDNQSARVWLSLLYEERKDWADAIKYLGPVVEKEPSGSGYIRLSYYYTQTGQVSEAVEALKKAVKTDPKSHEASFFLAIAYLDLKDYKNAEKYLLKTTELNKNLKEPYYYLGVIYEQRKKFRKSVANFRKVLELDPDNSSALNYLGYSFADRGINLDEAQQMIEKAVTLEPDNTAYADSLGWVYYEQGKYEKSEEVFRKIVDKTNDPLVLEHFGDTLMKLQKKDEAVKYFNKAHELDGNNKKLTEKIKRIKK